LPRSVRQLAADTYLGREEISPGHFLKLLPGFRILAYLRNCEKKGNEYCNSPTIAEIKQY
jgi:hypothetical protein